MVWKMHYTNDLAVIWNVLLKRTPIWKTTSLIRHCVERASFEFPIVQLGAAKASNVRMQGASTGPSTWGLLRDQQTWAQYFY